MRRRASTAARRLLPRLPLPARRAGAHCRHPRTAPRRPAPSKAATAPPPAAIGGHQHPTADAAKPQAPERAPREWVRKDERRAARVRAEAPGADVLVHPDIGYYAGHDADYRRRVIAIARRETERRMPEIRAAMARADLAQPSATVSSLPGVATR